MTENKNAFQLIWGIILVFAGGGVFIMIPRRMTEIASIEQFSSPGAGLVIRLCFYLLGALLIWGGGKKIYVNSMKSESKDVKED